MKRTLLALLVVFPSMLVARAEVDAVLDAYVKVSAALAADDLAAAKKASASLETVAKEEDNAVLAKEAGAVAQSDSIGKARESFKALSKTVIPLAKGRKGYYVMTCPMTKDGDWVQNDPQVANPYFGSEMLTCGMVGK